MYAKTALTKYTFFNKKSQNRTLCCAIKDENISEGKEIK